MNGLQKKSICIPFDKWDHSLVEKFPFWAHKWLGIYMQNLLVQSTESINEHSAKPFCSCCKNALNHDCSTIFSWLWYEILLAILVSFCLMVFSGTLAFASTNRDMQIFDPTLEGVTCWNITHLAFEVFLLDDHSLQSNYIMQDLIPFDHSSLHYHAIKPKT